VQNLGMVDLKVNEVWLLSLVCGSCALTLT
jgi:hypothetical protein